MFGISIEFYLPIAIIAASLLLSAPLSRRPELMRRLLVAVGVSSFGLAAFSLLGGNSGSAASMMIAAAVALGASEVSRARSR